MGETVKATQLLEQVMKIKATTLKEDHPDCLTSISMLALCHYRLGSHKEAFQHAKGLENAVQNLSESGITHLNATHSSQGTLKL
jgi:hypothetical protein